jgi:acyl-CoA reductase-like NAD-dependent aldehyde dehydrogenase
MSVQVITKTANEVEKFLGQSPQQLFIGGEWVGSSEGKTFQTVDPGTGAVLAEVHEASIADVDAALRAASEAFRSAPWARLGPNERAVYLHRLADLVESRQDVLAEIESLDVGKPLPQANWDIQNFSQTMRYYADLSVQARYREWIAVSRHEARTVHQPRGVCGFIFPWNFPFCSWVGASPLL